MLPLLSLEEIEALLLKVPALIKRFEERDPDFFQAVKSWLTIAEDRLSNNRMSVAAEIAVCRAELISVERGFSEGSALRARMGARTLKSARASHLIKRATNVISDAIRFRRGQADEASRIMMQIVAVADHLGLITAEAGQNHSVYLQTILQSISNRAELTSLVVHVSGLMGRTDTLIVLDRAISSIRQ